MIRGNELQKTDLLWAGVVFNSSELDHSSSSLPSHVSFKIRMDKDRVDSTTRIQDKLVVTEDICSINLDFSACIYMYMKCGYQVIV